MTDTDTTSKVVVYSTPTCPWCRMLKDFLKEHKIDYVDIDVSSNADAAREMVAKSGQRGVPQCIINGRLIVGFDQDAIEEELKKIGK